MVDAIAEVSAVLFGRVDDETFERVVRILGSAETHPKRLESPMGDLLRQAVAERDTLQEDEQAAHEQAEQDAARIAALEGVFEDAIAFGHNLALNSLGHTSGAWRDCPQRLCERARAALAAPTADAECTHPGCGLPNRLHGSPDRSRPTHSSHWFRAAPADAWTEMESDPTFVAGMERARQDFAAGRVEAVHATREHRHRQDAARIAALEKALGELLVVAGPATDPYSKGVVDRARAVYHAALAAPTDAEPCDCRLHAPERFAETGP